VSITVHRPQPGTHRMRALIEHVNAVVCGAWTRRSRHRAFRHVTTPTALVTGPAGAVEYRYGSSTVDICPAGRPARGVPGYTLHLARAVDRGDRNAILATLTDLYMQELRGQGTA
jgi:hypothetical protein